MLRGILSVIIGMLLQTGLNALHTALPAQPASAEAPATVSPAAVRDLTPPAPEDQVITALPFSVMLGGCGPAVAINPEAMLNAAAGALNLTPDELQAKLNAGQTLGAVANELGVDRATVTAALQAAAIASLQAELEAAVKAGDLTQAQADQRLSDFEGQDFSAWLDQPFALVMPGISTFPLPFGGDLPEGGVTMGVDMGAFSYEMRWQLDDGARYTFTFDDTNDAFRQAAADALGLTVDELAVRLEAGETLPDIAAAQNVTSADLQAALHTAMLAAARADVAAAVAAGRLTQAQADQILDEISHMDEHPVFTFPGTLPDGLPQLPFPHATPKIYEEDTTTY